MTDREKVIKEFELFIKEFHPACTSEGVELDMFREVLALLKEQEPVKVRHLHGTKVTVHEEIVFTDECENCSGYLLKHWKACPICGKPVIWE